MRTANVKVVEEGLLVKGSFVVISSAVQVSAAISMAAEREEKTGASSVIYSQLQVSESRFICCKRSGICSRPTGNTQLKHQVEAAPVNPVNR